MAGSPFLDSAYMYMNAFILAFGFWAIVAPESTDSVLMVINKKTLTCFILFFITKVFCWKYDKEEEEL